MMGSEEWGWGGGGWWWERVTDRQTEAITEVQKRTEIKESGGGRERETEREREREKNITR